MYGALKNRGSILTKAWKKASLPENLESSGKFPLSRSDDRVNIAITVTGLLAANFDLSLNSQFFGSNVWCSINISLLYAINSK